MAEAYLERETYKQCISMSAKRMRIPFMTYYEMCECRSNVRVYM